jgi:hypothetical protein
MLTESSLFILSPSLSIFLFSFSYHLLRIKVRSLHNTLHVHPHQLP